MTAPLVLRPAERDAQLLTDGELRRWRRFYERRLALVAEEAAPDLLDAARDWYAYHAGIYREEEARRLRARAAGVPRDRDPFPAETVARLKALTNLDGALEREYAAVLGPERDGRRRGACPIHGGDNPTSLVVYVADPEDQHYHCHACGAHGDIYTLLEQRHGCDFPAAVRLLAAYRGERTGGDPPAQDRFRRLVAPHG